MKYIIILFHFSLVITGSGLAQIQSVKIGAQTWTSTNLTVTHFRNGDEIKEAKTGDQWVRLGMNGEPAWCYFKFDVNNMDVYGILYNSYAVKDPRGLAPAGWHIPSEKEWETLIKFLGGRDLAGNKLKSSEGWMDDKNGSNSSGFKGLPGGQVDGEGGSFSYLKIAGWWWSTTPYENSSDYTEALSLWDSETVAKLSGMKNVMGLSVRCVKD